MRPEELRRPSADEVERLAALDEVELAAGEAEELQPVVAAIVAAAAAALAFEEPRLHAPVREWWTPPAEENPYNAFITRCRAEGAAGGLLAGRSVGVKDNISVAGVPTSNGSRLPSFTPAVDAVVVERILAAGGTIVGKLNMDDFGAAGTGETSAFGPPRNPINSAYSAGGSSGGSGAAVRSGECDLALAVDQGGSGRIPAAFCGLVAAKGTHGLVPSQGVTHIDHTIDCVTPIACTVRDAALMLEAVSGADARDPQWVRGPVATARYTKAEAAGVEGLVIGIVDESCSTRYCVSAVLDGVERAAAALRAEGASIERFSLPLWERALAIFQPYIGCLVSNMFRSENEGYGHLGEIDAERIAWFGRVRREHSVDLAKQVKSWLVADRYLHELSANAIYARLHNLRLRVRREISAALERYDLLLTPTLPITAPRLWEGPASFADIAARTSAALCFNTAPLNLSGHPALSVPSGADADGLPTGVQLVGRYWGEAQAFRAAFALERALGPFGEPAVRE